MARPTVWRRWQEAYADAATASGTHSIRLCSLLEGETLTRVRFAWQAQHVATFPSEAVGISIGVGIVVVPGLAPSPTLIPYLFDDPTADWLFVEDANFYPYNVAYEEGTINELDIAPASGTQRDGRAQRRATEDSSVYLTAQIPGGFATQAAFYFSASGSCLVIEV